MHKSTTCMPTAGAACPNHAGTCFWWLGRAVLCISCIASWRAGSQQQQALAAKCIPDTKEVECMETHRLLLLSVSLPLQGGAQAAARTVRPSRPRWNQQRSRQHPRCYPPCGAQWWRDGIRARPCSGGVHIWQVHARGQAGHIKSCAARGIVQQGCKRGKRREVRDVLSVHCIPFPCPSENGRGRGIVMGSGGPRQKKC